MTLSRKIKRMSMAIPTMEGAGVHLERGFGSHDVPDFDPFLLFDDFRSENPSEYIKGFPWHPHRGIETITYIIEGHVEHGDSIGNAGIISAGDIQWMTAGSGIIHQEMPGGDQAGRMGGFQLWANLPSSRKMMKPRYQEIKSEQVPQVTTVDGILLRVICGEIQSVTGPVKEIVIDPEYLDITMPEGKNYTHPTKRGHTVFAYVFEGQLKLEREEKSAANRSVILFEDGDTIEFHTEDAHARFLLISGKQVNEPVAWSGPIVMNTQEELSVAFDEYQKGTFIKKSYS